MRHQQAAPRIAVSKSSVSTEVLTMKIRSLLIAVASLGFAGCSVGITDKTIDGGSDRKSLSELQAGIWVDPNGCDHWIIDDGAEGYLSARLDPQGKPVCSGAAFPTQATGDFKQGFDPN
jgi:hypothetical protein